MTLISAVSNDGQPALSSAQRVVPRAVGVPAAGRHTLPATQLLNLANTPVYLRDRLSGVLIDLAQQPSYTFMVGNAAVLVQGRFELVFSPRQVLAQQVGLYPNPAESRITIELLAGLGRQPTAVALADAVGHPVRTQVLPTGLPSYTLLLNELATGVYLLHLRTEAGTVVKKLIMQQFDRQSAPASCPLPKHLYPSRSGLRVENMKFAG